MTEELEADSNPFTDRPSLAELASATNGVASWDCPKCKCRDWRTVNSYLTNAGTRNRRKKCRNCGYIRMTYEVPGE